MGGGYKCTKGGGGMRTCGLVHVTIQKHFSSGCKKLARAFAFSQISIKKIIRIFETRRWQAGIFLSSLGRTRFFFFLPPGRTPFLPFFVFLPAREIKGERRRKFGKWRSEGGKRKKINLKVRKGVLFQTHINLHCTVGNHHRVYTKNDYENATWGEV